MKTPGKDLKKWLRFSTELNGANIDSAIDALKRSLSRHRFKTIQEEDSGSFCKIKAIFGSKVLATILGLIPFGTHFPAGKRLCLIATLSESTTLKLDLEIVPYMGLFDEEEIGGASQSMSERLTDELFGARKLRRVLADIHDFLSIPLPEAMAGLSGTELTKDSLLGILLYPMDSYRSPQILHMTAQKGPNWCWGGFLLPEIWFLWHEIWGVSLIAALPTFLFVAFADREANLFIYYSLLLLVVATRFFLGLYGNRLFFARHGRWPSSPLESD